MVKLLYKLHLYSWAESWCARFHSEEWRGVRDPLGRIPTIWTCFACGRRWQTTPLNELMLRGVSESVRKEHGL